MLQLNDLLPLSQHEQYWTFYGSEHEGLPDGAEYVVFEYYCGNPTCDCKHLMADVMKIGADGNHIEQPLAIIDFYWSTEEKACHPKLTNESPKTKLARHILEAYKSFVHDEEYLRRVKRQYSQVKALTLSNSVKPSVQKVNQKKKIGRNELCDCGSGIKYKKCCMVA